MKISNLTPTCMFHIAATAVCIAGVGAATFGGIEEVVKMTSDVTPERMLLAGVAAAALGGFGRAFLHCGPKAADALKL